MTRSIAKEILREAELHDDVFTMALKDIAIIPDGIMFRIQYHDVIIKEQIDGASSVELLWRGDGSSIGKLSDIPPYHVFIAISDIYRQHQLLVEPEFYAAERIKRLQRRKRAFDVELLNLCDEIEPGRS